jgi:predicted carbohydrate-binding protein with CBM5 and CBM33 domain
MNFPLSRFLPVLILCTAGTAFGHGSLTDPKSRVRRVYEALPQNPRPVWAAQAVALDGESSYYTWNQLSRNFPAAINGNSQLYVDNIPDGQLASAGNHPANATLPGHPGLSFSGLDSISSAWSWPATAATAGVKTFSFLATAPHDPSFFQVWITTAAWTPQMPLRWADLEYLGQPVATKTGNIYTFDVLLPARTGRAVAYVAWQRVDPAGEVFFAASDLDYGGGATGGGGLELNAGAVTVSESVGNASVRVTLSGPAPADGVRVAYAVSPGSATTADYTPVSGVLNFAAGEISRTINVPITDDALAEAEESFFLTLSNPAGTTKEKRQPLCRKKLAAFFPGFVR